MPLALADSVDGAGSVGSALGWVVSVLPVGVGVADSTVVDSTVVDSPVVDGAGSAGVPAGETEVEESPEGEGEEVSACATSVEVAGEGDGVGVVSADA